MLNEKLKKFLESEEFKNRLLKCSTEEDMMKIFSDNGIDLSSEEVQVVKKCIEKACKSDNELLLEEQLEEIAGGVPDIGKPFRALTYGLTSVVFAFPQGVKLAVVENLEKMDALRRREERVRKR